MKSRKSVPDTDLLQGTWTVASLEMDGHKMPAAILTGAHLILDGDRFQSIGMGATYEGKLTLDQGADPKALDLKFTKGPEKGNTAFGIYQLKGDVWKICLTTRVTTDPADRPKKFAANPGTGHALEIVKRAGKSRSAREGLREQGIPAVTRWGSTTPRKLVSKSSKASGPATEIEGEWSMVSGNLDGKPLDVISVRYGKRVIRGNLTTLTFGPDVYQKATFRLDASKSPREIDYQHSQGMFAGKHQLGIYECDGKTLKLSASKPGTPRPRDFKPGPERNVTTFKLAGK